MQGHHCRTIPWRSSPSWVGPLPLSPWWLKSNFTTFCNFTFIYVVIHSKVNAFLSISVSMCILKLLLENNSLSTQTILCTVFTVQGYVLHSLDSISVVCFTLCVFHHSSAVIVKYHYISLFFFYLKHKLLINIICVFLWLSKLL